MTRELSPREAASRLGTTTRTIQRWIGAGRLPARRVGGRWRVASDALDAFIARAGEGGPQEVTERNRIRTLYIANRGEIAARIKRTAEDLGIQAIAALDT